LIRHRGRGADYLVLHWWDRENELFCRVCTTANDDAAGWRIDDRDGAPCVWDQVVIGAERDAYAATILSRAGPPDVDGYLRRVPTRRQRRPADPTSRSAPGRITRPPLKGPNRSRRPEPSRPSGTSKSQPWLSTRRSVCSWNGKAV